MRIAIAAAAAALLTLPAIAPGAAHAQDRREQSWDMKQSTTLRTGWYGTLSGAWLMPEDTDGRVGGTGVIVERDDGYGIFGAAGYRFPGNLRAEAELGYGTMDFDSARIGAGRVGLGGDVDMYSLTGAGFYDIPTGTVLTPYLGAGAGLVHQRLDRASASFGGTTVAADNDSSTDLTAFAEAGVTIKVAQFELVPAYRYQWIDDGDGGFDDTTLHMLRLGLRHWF